MAQGLTLSIRIAEADHAWEDGDLTWHEPASAHGPPPAAAWYWRKWAPGAAPEPQPRVPAPAPAHAPSKPDASSNLPSWAHAAQYFSSAAQVSIHTPDGSSLPQHLLVAASPSQQRARQGAPVSLAPEAVCPHKTRMLYGMAAAPACSGHAGL